MGYLKLRPEQSNIFFNLMEERYGKAATIITTNLEYEDWYELTSRRTIDLGDRGAANRARDRIEVRGHVVATRLRSGDELLLDLREPAHDRAQRVCLAVEAERWDRRDCVKQLMAKQPPAAGLVRFEFPRPKRDVTTKGQLAALISISARARPNPQFSSCSSTSGRSARCSCTGPPYALEVDDAVELVVGRFGVCVRTEAGAVRCSNASEGPALTSKIAAGVVAWSARGGT